MKRWLCLTVCAAACAAALCSLTWRMVNDTPIMLYQANLMVKHGLMPYRDFFCINVPGALWMYGGLIAIAGVSDLSVHVANLLIVVLISIFSYLTLARSCRWCAVLGVSLTVLRIFSGESAFILERELLALIPLSGLIFVGLNSADSGLKKGALAGVLLAWIFLIKPQLVLYGVPVVVYLWMTSESLKTRFRLLLIMGVCFALPVAACGVWLVKNGAWPRFCETLVYWTLYGQMSQSFTFVPLDVRVHLIFSHVLRMLFSPYMVVAVAALYVARRSAVLNCKELCFWGLLLVMTILVPALSGQFWGYHRLPFYYFTLCASGYLLAGRKWPIGLAVLVALVWMPFTALRVYRETTVSSVVRQKYGVPDVFENYLKEHLRPGDRVQPIDWTCGAIQGMLLADALPATRFIESSYFIHSVSHPLIQALRQEFLESLRERPPRFILEALSVNWPNGIDTETRFVPFETWRDLHYRVRKEGTHYRIWEVAGND